MERPEVSAVIAVYNEQNCIAACIGSLRSQALAPGEILVVDDGSTDASVEICTRLGAKVITQAHRGPGAARNLGARHAAGDILLFVDADMTFAPDYVLRLLAPITRGAAPGATHWDEMVANWDNPWARVQTWFMGCPDRRRHLETDSGKTTVYRAVRKDFFIAAGGFAEDEGRADDSSLYRATGQMPLVVRGAVCYHKNIEGAIDAFYDARWRGRDIGSKIATAATLARVALIDRNPLRDLLKGLKIAADHGEPRALIYGAIFSAGILCGLLSAYLRKNYLK